MNAWILAWAWTVVGFDQTEVSLRRTSGALAPVLCHLLSSGSPVQLLRLLSWRLLLQDWSEPDAQHDVCEFGMYLLQRVRAPVCNGQWQARDVAPPYTAYVRIHTHMITCVHLYKCIHLDVYMHIYIHICMHVCV